VPRKRKSLSNNTKLLLSYVAVLAVAVGGYFMLISTDPKIAIGVILLFISRDMKKSVIKFESSLDKQAKKK